MSLDPDAKTESQANPRIVVAGDVCIDWLSIPVESHVPKEDSPAPMNWQLRGGRHMYAERGGAWLTADFVGAAVGDSARVSKPAEENLPLANIPPEEIIHSMLTLGPKTRERNKENVPYWVVTHFEGYAGPTNTADLKVIPVENDDREAQLVLLDDAGNGFRDNKAAWPLALNKGCKPMVLYKVRRPLGDGPLWEHLKAFHLERTVALLSADELRGEGGCIGRGLSWEQSATDLILALANEPRFMALLSCPFLIVPFALEAVVLVRCENGRVKSARLWYRPNLIEGKLMRSGLGEMSGFGSVFAAAVASALIKSHDGPSWNAAKVDQALQTGIDNGLVAMRNLLEEAFGPCEVNDPENTKRKIRQPLKYPKENVFTKQPSDKRSVFSVELPAPPSEQKKIPAFRSWRILDSQRNKCFVELAGEVVRRGAEKVFADVPIGRFGKFVTLDRREIESYRSILNLIKEFLYNPKPERPLCLGVFGPPGGGKSFGIAAVARSLDKGAPIEKLDFNVSQWTEPEHLVNALHRVRDYALLGKVPLVFFDEFDSRVGTQELAWLKYFLAPMQDGVFADGSFTHQIGKAIFVFAGGTVDKFEQLRAKAESADDETETAARKDEIRSTKLLDFISRLRGHVDVFGVNGPSDTNLLRRALILRSNINKKFPTLLDASGSVRMDEGVLRAFLQIPKYHHGARSLEAILDMSHLVDHKHFDPSLLPPLHQLNLHVNGEEFMDLIQRERLVGEKINEVAKEIHELYFRLELAEKNKDGSARQIGDQPSWYHWEDERLGDLYKNSSREQAASYPTLLAAVGYGFEKTEEDDPERRAAKKSDTKTVLVFSSEEIEKLARMEHERWMQERRIKQPDHPDLKSWEELKKEEQDKDRRTIKAIPEILSKVGLRVVRLS